MTGTLVDCADTARVGANADGRSPRSELAGTLSRELRKTVDDGETLGVEVQAIDPGVVVLAFGHDDRLTQQHGLIHAGMLGTVLDSACGWAALSLMSADHAVLTVEYKLNLLRPAEGERFTGTGRVIKPGHTLTVAEGVLVETSAPDRPIATMTATLMAVAGRGIKD